jgi:hypothetical protein
MIARSYRNIRERLTHLEAQLKPLVVEAQLKPLGRTFVFFRYEQPDLPPYAEHLAAFKGAQNNVGPNDALHTIRIIFAGPR